MTTGQTNSQKNPDLMEAGDLAYSGNKLYTTAVHNILNGSASDNTVKLNYSVMTEVTTDLLAPKTYSKELFTVGDGLTLDSTTSPPTLNAGGGGALTYANTNMSGSISTLYNAVKGLSVGDIVIVSGYGAINKTYYDAMGGSFCGVVTNIDSTTVYLNAAGTVYYCDSSSTDYAGPYPIGCAGTDYSISISYSEIWAGTIQGTNVQVGKIFSKGMYGYVTTLHFS